MALTLVSWCSPFFADRYGRRCPIIIGCIIETAGALLGTFSTGYGTYLAGRFILGFGSSFNSGMAGLLITEMYVRSSGKIQGPERDILTDIAPVHTHNTVPRSPPLLTACTASAQPPAPGSRSRR